MEHLINSIGSGMIMTDALGRIQSLNQAAEAILGYTTKELQNRLIDNEIQLHSEGYSPVLRALRQGQNQDRIDTILIKKSGETILAGASVYLLMDDGVIGAVEIFRDLSDIKAHERQERLAALEGMAAEIAHEIYNPLGGIKGFASILMRKIQDDPGRYQIERIIKGVNSIEQVVNNFLLYARPMRPRFSIVDVHQFLDTCLSQNVSVPVEKNYGASIPELEMDVEQMQQAITNLLITAGRTLPTVGTLRVRTRTVDQRWVRIIIEDSGIGDHSDANEQVFDPFYTTKKTGTGLGLAVAYRIIEAHQGKIYVRLDSAQVTAFVIELPIDRTTVDPSRF